MSATYNAAISGKLPASPFLVVGQTSVVDPSRVPPGSNRHILWIQVRCLPAHIQGDALDKIHDRSWDAISESYADRVMDKLEAYAPGITGLITARRVLSPLDLERDNPCLAGGDSVGGSHHLKQNFLFRPLPGWSRYKTPIDALYMCGAGTYPGGGVNGVSGYNVAQEVLSASSRQSRILTGTALAGAGLLAANWLRKRTSDSDLTQH